MLLPTATIDGEKVADKLLTNVTVGDKMCHVRSARPMLLPTATIDGEKVTDERDGRRQDVPRTLCKADVADDCDGRRSENYCRLRRSAETESRRLTGRGKVRSWRGVKVSLLMLASLLEKIAEDFDVVCN